MRTLVISLALAFVMASVSRAAPAATSVGYRLSPEFQGDALSALKVEIRFKGARGGVTPLMLPEGYGATSDGWRVVRDLKIAGATAVESPDPARRVIRARPGAPLVVTYRVLPTYDHDPRIGEAQSYRPIIRPTWFEAVGSSLFARPFAEHEEEATPARFDWAGPPELGFASDLEAVGGERRTGTKRGTLADIRTSVVIGGKDLRIARSGQVRFAAIGDYAFSPEQVAGLADRILHAERGFWGDPDAPFLVTMAPEVAPSALSKSVNGTGRGGGFATLLTPNVTLGDLAELFAHENFHTWNSAQLGGQGQHGSLGYWFSEGFTDFYARRMLVRAGAIGPEAFAELWNNMLIAYGASPARAFSNEKAAEAFWTDRFAQKVLYQRGAMLAAMWDARLRANSGGKRSLDDVMRAQRVAAARTPGTPAYRLFPGVAARFGLEVNADLLKYVEQGAPITLAPDVFGPCATVRWREQATYDRGWDTAATSAAGGVITGLREGSSGYRAGLRNGMLLVGRSFEHPEDSTAESMVRARIADGSEREFRFKPEGDGRISVQHVELTPQARGGGCPGF